MVVSPGVESASCSGEVATAVRERGTPATEGVKKMALDASRSGGLLARHVTFQGHARLKAASTNGLVDFFIPSQRAGRRRYFAPDFSLDAGA